MITAFRFEIIRPTVCACASSPPSLSLSSLLKNSARRELTRQCLFLHRPLPKNKRKKYTLAYTSELCTCNTRTICHTILEIDSRYHCNNICRMRHPESIFHFSKNFSTSRRNPLKIFGDRSLDGTDRQQKDTIFHEVATSSRTKRPATRARVNSPLLSRPVSCVREKRSQHL